MYYCFAFTTRTARTRVRRVYFASIFVIYTHVPSTILYKFDVTGHNARYSAHYCMYYSRGHKALHLCACMYRFLYLHLSRESRQLYNIIISSNIYERGRSCTLQQRRMYQRRLPIARVRRTSSTCVCVCVSFDVILYHVLCSFRIPTNIDVNLVCVTG